MNDDELRRLIERLDRVWASEFRGCPLPGDVATAIDEYRRCRRYLSAVRR